jgi:SpoVK/Ycf46/Vps4 family AAA+-type ATPase
MIVGLPGGGKSLTAKALAATWQVPLIRWDVGAMRSKYVGESEANVRKVIQILESLGQCVLWLDEIEKALAGSTGPQGDGGVASDALGTILSWMQERTCPVFVVATANDVRALPPELLRKGRFDEVWWVDLPTHAERVAIARASLSAFGRTLDDAELGEIADATDGFVGAEIAAVIPDALFAAFADGERALTVADVVAAAKAVTPLSETAREKIEDLRKWATGRARSASTGEAAPKAGTGRRTLDI